MMQNERIAIIFRQRPQRPVQFVERLARFKARPARIDVGPQLASLPLVPPARLQISPPPQRRITRRAVQPTRQTSPRLQIRRPIRQRHEYILRRILGVLRDAAMPEADSVNHRPIPPDDLVECLAIGLIGGILPEQLTIREIPTFHEFTLCISSAQYYPASGHKLCIKILECKTAYRDPLAKSANLAKFQHAFYAALMSSPLPALDPTPTSKWTWPLIALLAAGDVLFLLNLDFYTHPQYIAAVLAAAIAMIPAVARPLSRILDKLNTPSNKVRWIIGAIIFVLSARYFLLSASLADRRLFPTYHDEFMYLLQAQMLAHGRLWMPPHPLGDFFNSFFVITKPVYAASYFPGTALLNVPGVWMNLAPSATGVIIAGLSVTLLYLIATEMIGGVTGILAALLALSLEQMRVVSVMTMSHSAMLLLFLLTLWAYLHWRKHRRIPWAIAIGAFAGWAAITRPLDAICLILPLGVAMLWDLRTLPRKRAVITLAVVVIAALPFLSLQLILDKGTTGHFLQSPITVYGQANFPGLAFGFHPYTGPLESPSPLPQVRDYYRDFLGPLLQQHGTQGFFKTWISQRWKPDIDVSIPGGLLLILLPAGLLAIRRPAVAALVTGAILFPLAFTFYPTYLNHYGLVTAPAYILLILLAFDKLRKRFPIASAAIAIAIATLAITSLPEVRRQHDHFMDAIYLADINLKLATLPHTPAVVLFHYVPGKSDIHEEPVFNIDTPWPDDAEVIRAQDLGPENHRIFEYYAKYQPNRFFYQYNRSTGELSERGWATDLVPKPASPSSSAH